jgi:aldehyde dehydrogenase (NAD+)
MDILLQDPVSLAAQAAEAVKLQRQYFATNITKKLDFRRRQLTKLRQLLVEHEDEIIKALHSDLHKHEFEAYATEVGFVVKDLDKALSKLDKWAAPQAVSTPLFHFKANSYTMAEPYGNTLIIAPWNYPFQLLFAPIIGAMAAGNTAIVKPSEYAPATAKIAAKIINQNFEPQYLHLVEGGIAETQALLAQKFDYIFFTGGTGVGKVIYKAAAEHLTPVTLELGGKSPCIVDYDTQLNYTAKRLVWGKFVNAGQTCIAPDYVLVDKKIKAALIEKIKHYITKFYGDNPQKSDSYGRIINERHFERIIGYLKDGKIVHGGQHDISDKFIAPTVIDAPDLNAPLMQDEIFGPLLPIIEYEDIREAIDFIKQRPKPLALYIFSKNDLKIQRILSETSAGGVTINDTLMHIANSDLPFGGVGDSGIGAYHGQHSFNTFSHTKAVLHRSFLVEEPVRYAPYNKVSRKWLKRIMDWTL